jgi:hypothetical protein
MTETDTDTAYISTSDRTAFRSCRRKWNWSSPLRESLQKVEKKHPLWFGSGMHHVLEDFHGEKVYKHTDDAIKDYLDATKKEYGPANLPDTLSQDGEMMSSIMSHYKDGWLKARNRSPLETYEVKGEPQVEVPFEFEIPLPKDVLSKSGYKRVVYRGVLDRVVVDDDGYLWIQDYKNVARFTDQRHLELDSQIGAYLWAASYIYKRPTIGFIYTQFRKTKIEPPRILNSGDISAAKDQNTTYFLYRSALHVKYGPNNIPESNIACLNHMATLEELEADKFIRRDRVTRTKVNHTSEAEKILAEVTEMLNPDLAMYPNPNFMCPAMCSFVEPCLATDRGEDPNDYLEIDYAPQSYKQRNEWRKHLKLGRRNEKEVLQISASTGKTSVSMSKSAKKK